MLTTVLHTIVSTSSNRLNTNKTANLYSKQAQSRQNKNPSFQRDSYWWTLPGSNRPPLPCKGSALPNELRAHTLPNELRRFFWCTECSKSEKQNQYLYEKTQTARRWVLKGLVRELRLRGVEPRGRGGERVSGFELVQDFLGQNACLSERGALRGILG